MRKNKTMYKFIKDNYKELNIEVINIDEFQCEFKCNICGAIKNITLNSMGQLLKNKSDCHTESCSEYFNSLIKKELGQKRLSQFRGFYRYAKERCCNPKNKDYVRYSGKFHFKDYTHYYNECYNIYKEAYHIYGVDLSIDRVDNSKGYEPNNIRFVPMRINAQNKDKIYPVMCVDIVTKKILECSSLTEMADKYFEGKHTSLYQALTENRLYLKRWKIFYI